MKSKKYILFTALGYVGIAIFLVSLLFLIRETSPKVLFGILLFVGLVMSITFALIAQKYKNAENLVGSNNNVSLEDHKSYLVDFAFDNLLKEGEDYTVVARVEKAKLVKKIPKWFYFEYDRAGKLHALFTITTDKGEFGFQAEGNSLIRVEAEMINSMYEDADKEDNNNEVADKQDIETETKKGKTKKSKE